jgi:LysR family transcriptional regulator, pca operon transcriptional activator
MDPRLRLRHLGCFMKTAQFESLSAAADAMHVSQPAASKTIRELEEILGVELFDRSGRRMSLTAAGRLFQRYAGSALVELQRAQDMVRKSPVERSRLTVGVLPTAATKLVPRAALRFREEFPNCIIQVMTGPNWLLVSQLREGALDLIVGRMPETERMTGLAFQQLYSEHAVLVVRPGHPLTQKPFEPSDLERFPLMFPPKGAVIAAAVRAYVFSVGLHHCEPDFETVSLAFGRKVVQESDTVWFISQGVVAEEVMLGTLMVLDPGTPVLTGPVGISFRDNTTLTPEQRGLITVLVDMTHEVRESEAPGRGLRATTE